MSDNYPELFARYAAHTDGKKIIAAELIKLYPNASALRLADLGAGSGEIATRLAQAFKQITAVEPKGAFVDTLKQQGLPNLEAVQATIQDFETAHVYDVALLSYVLDSQAQPEIGRILDKIETFLAPQGQVIGVTFLEGCAWEIFSTYTANLMQWQRGGGLNYVQAAVVESGRQLQTLKVVETKITGKNLDDLYGNLAFYCRQQPALYQQLRKPIMRKLQELVVQGLGFVYLPVQEVIFEIGKRRSLESAP